MAKVFFSFGSNLGDRRAQIGAAMEEIQKRAGKFTKKSRLYETEPWGKKDQPWFLNACAELRTETPPAELFEICQAIEQKAGRPPKHEKWGPRFLDIDILFWGERIVSTKQLKIPHPQIPNRRFILAPLAEIAPDFRHPVLKKTISQLLKECQDSSIVRPQ